MSSQRTVRCKCGTGFTIPAAPGVYACPDCGAALRLRAKDPTAGGARAAPAPSAAGGVSAASGARPPAPRRPHGPQRGRQSKSAAPSDPEARSADAEHAAPTAANGSVTLIAWALIALGAVCMLVGLGLWAGSPYDEAEVSSERRRLGEIKARLAGLERDLESARTATPDLDQEVAAAQLVASDLADEAARLRAQIEVSDRELATAQQRLAEQRKRLAAVGQAVAEFTDEIERAEAELDPRQVIAAVKKATLVIHTDVGAGSGFVFDRRGRALSNYHVIRCSSELHVYMPAREGDELIEIPGAKLIAADPDVDLALIQLPPEPPPAVDRDGGYPELAARPIVDTQTRVRIGETVYAVGNPSLGQELLTHTATKGIVSSNLRRNGGVELLQFTASINPGNSGGPLVDSSGKALGVITSKGVNVEAMGFALTMRMVQGFLRNSERRGYAISGDLADWERTNAPADSIARRGLNFRPDRTCVFAEALSDIHLVNGDTLLLVHGATGTLSLFDTAANKTRATLALDNPIADVAIDKDARRAWVLCPGAGRLSTVRLSPFAVEEHYRHDGLARGHSLVGLEGDTEMMAVVTDNAPLVFLDTRRLEDGLTEALFRFGDTEALALTGGDEYAFLLQSRGSTLELRAVDAEDLTSTVRKGLHGRSRANQAPNRIEAMHQLSIFINTANQRLFQEAPTGVYDLQALLRAGSAPHPPIPVGHDRVIFCRRLIKATRRGLTTEQVLPPNPQWQELRGLSMEEHGFLMWLDRIVAVSPDGRYAASGSCVYDLERCVPIAQLPCLACSVHFAADGRSLFILDASGESLATIIDWRESLPPATEDAGE